MNNGTPPFVTTFETIFPAQITNVTLAPSTSNYAGQYLHSWVEMSYSYQTGILQQSDTPRTGTYSNTDDGEIVINPLVTANNVPYIIAPDPFSPFTPAEDRLDNTVWIKQLGLVNGQMFYVVVANDVRPSYPIEITSSSEEFFEVGEGWYECWYWYPSMTVDSGGKPTFTWRTGEGWVFAPPFTWYNATQVGTGTLIGWWDDDIAGAPQPVFSMAGSCMQTDNDTYCGFGGVDVLEFCTPGGGFTTIADDGCGGEFAVGGLGMWLTWTNIEIGYELSGTITAPCSIQLQLVDNSGDTIFGSLAEFCIPFQTATVTISGTSHNIVFTGYQGTGAATMIGLINSCRGKQVFMQASVDSPTGSGSPSWSNITLSNGNQYAINIADYCGEACPSPSPSSEGMAMTEDEEPTPKALKNVNGKFVPTSLDEALSHAPPAVKEMYNRVKPKPKKKRKESSSCSSSCDSSDSSLADEVRKRSSSSSDPKAALELADYIEKKKAEEKNT
jgi:hypothetical protein